METVCGIPEKKVSKKSTHNLIHVRGGLSVSFIIIVVVVVIIIVVIIIVVIIIIIIIIIIIGSTALGGPWPP